MSWLWYILLFGSLAGLGWFFFPLLKSGRSATLPVVFIGKVGTAYSNTKDKSEWTSAKHLERFFVGLTKRGFQSILPQQILNGKLPPRSVLLVFGGGYQRIYTEVLPLLQKYNLKAAITLPAGLVGQYDAWQNSSVGPWQNLLTKSQIKDLQQSSQIEFISTVLDGSDLTAETDETALWKIHENKQRLKSLYGIKANMAYIPLSLTSRPAIWAGAEQDFPILLSHAIAANPLPLEKAKPLACLPLFKFFFLTRLFWLMK